MSDQKICYGIDFGTTNSTIAYFNHKKGVVLLPLEPCPSNPYVVESVIYVSPDGQFLFGKAAVDAYVSGVAEYKGSGKKTIFTGNYIRINDEKGHDQLVPEIIEVDVSNTGRLFRSLKSLLSNASISEINIFGKHYKVEELIGLFLKELKRRADKLSGQEVESAIFGRPVNYVGGNNKLAIRRMTQACLLAGFKDVIFEYEPIGAAMDYGLSHQKNQKVMVFDFGGGTLDLTVIDFPSRKVLLNSGISIGGDLFNSEIFMDKISKYFGSKAVYGDSRLNFPRHIFNSLESWYGISLLKTREFANTMEALRYKCSDKLSLYRLRTLIDNNLGFSMYGEIERVKKSLTSKNQELYMFHSKAIDIEEDIGRCDFEQIIKDDLSEIKDFLINSLTNAGLNPMDIDVIATTGGSSLIPAIQKLLISIFGNKKVQNTDAFTSVASGLTLLTHDKITSKPILGKT